MDPYTRLYSTRHITYLHCLTGHTLLLFTGLTQTGNINPRPAGPPDFPRPAGGCLNTPLLTRLLGHVATSGKRHSKARQKSFRNYFDHFFAEVNIEVTRGQHRSNFPVFGIFIQKSLDISKTMRARKKLIMKQSIALERLQ